MDFILNIFYIITSILISSSETLQFTLQIGIPVYYFYLKKYVTFLRLKIHSLYFNAPVWMLQRYYTCSRIVFMNNLASTRSFQEEKFDLVYESLNYGCGFEQRFWVTSDHMIMDVDLSKGLSDKWPYDWVLELSYWNLSFD